MNTLSYRLTKDHGLSIELLVDGQPLGELVGSSDTSIPYWMFKDDLPYRSGSNKKHNPLRIVSVCACGESGCGSTECKVLREGDTVVFRDFGFIASPEGRKKVFRFSAANYEAVISDVLKRVSEYKAAPNKRLNRTRDKQLC